MSPVKLSVKSIHSRIESAVNNGSHADATTALVHLAIADCEAALLRREEKTIGLEFRRALQRLLDGVQQLQPRPSENKRRKTNSNPNASHAHAVMTLPLLRPPPLPPLEASEFLLKDTVLPNSAIHKAVTQLRRGRYHPIVVLYGTVVDWTDHHHLSLYTPELILEEWPHNVRAGHQFTMLHILRGLRLSFTFGAIQDLDRVFTLEFLRSSTTLVNHPPTDTVPVFPNREWTRESPSTPTRGREGFPTPATCGCNL